MVSNSIRHALILAHQTDASGKVAGLVRTGGVPQLKRLLLTLLKAGLQRFVVVAGAHREALLALVTGDRQLRDLDIVWLTQGSTRTDGEAVLAARPHLRGDFFLCQVDHVFAPEILGALSGEPLDGATLAVTVNWSPTQADGLGVRLRRGGRLSAVGVGLHERDAIWTGVATCDASLFDILEDLHHQDSPARLQDAFGYLADAGRARVANVGNAYWHRVDTPAEVRQANSLLLASLRKPHLDGVIARNVNRYFSLFITRLVMGLPIRPNHVTFVTLLVSISAGVVAASATADSAWMIAAGAMLWQLASMLDGTDGELARLKFQGSKFGEWFDTIVDDLGRVCVFVGLGVGLTSVTGQAIWLQIMVATVAMQLIVNVRTYRQLLSLGQGSHFALAWINAPRVNPREQSWIWRLWTRIEFMGHRDYYIFLLMVLCIIQLPQVAVVVTFLTTGIVAGHALVRPRPAGGVPTRQPAFARGTLRA
jgi:choline kinase/phosphatidylglycerophosphate synthase